MCRSVHETRALVVKFCERYGQTCDAGCRGAALPERVMLQRLRLGVQR
jgi:hypothetical protein